MLHLEPQLRPTDGHLDLSLRHPDEWGYPEGMGMANGTFVRFGDDERGPVMFFFTVVPGIQLPESPAHGHASDNWRMSLKGVLPMGPDRYGPGQFRFHKGWKPYGSDAMSGGPDGGWATLVFGDRRGTKIRPVKEGSGPFPDERGICEWSGLAGDQVSDDPADGAGPAGLALSHVDLRGAHQNGGFEDGPSWPELLPGLRAVGALLGDATCGPLMVLEHADPGQEVAPAATLDTEVVRLVVEGSCTIDGTTYEAGDIRVQEAGAAQGAVVAGAAGLAEVVVYGDRRAVVADGAAGMWADAMDELLDGLRAKVPAAV